MTDTNKMREQFEVALVAKLVRELCAKAPGLPANAAELIVRSQWLERKGEGYAAPVPDHGWWAWQASREAVVVDLPTKTCIRANEYTPFEVVDVCRSAIKAQGLKVSP